MAEEKKTNVVKKEDNLFAVLGFIFSVSIILCIPGFILSLLGLLNANKYKTDRKKFALIGIIVSSVVFVISIVLLVVDPLHLLPSNHNNYNTNYNSSTSTKPVTKTKVEIIDFSSMNKSSIEEWCNSKKIKCYFYTEYSDTVEKDGFIKQSVSAGESINLDYYVSITFSLGKKPTVSQENALKSAQSYLRSSSFSYQGLVEQLEYEKYSHEDAVYAVDNCGADWNEQAEKEAKSYLRSSSFSYQGLIEQLEYEGFTHEQAVYGVDRSGADWNEQAKKCAASYLRYSSFSRYELIDQLEYEGFTYEQAVYGVEQNGL